MWARCHDGAQDRAVVVALLEAERDRQGRERGQCRERRAHAQRCALMEGQCIWHAQRLERCTRGQDLRLRERAAKGVDLGERVWVQIREDAWRGNARGMALEVEHL